MTTEQTNSEIKASAPVERLWVNAKLATMAAATGKAYGALEDFALGVAGDKITALLPMAAVEVSSFHGDIIDVQGRWITPGLIDCHTHMVWGGSRVHDWEKRLNGVSYVEIARQGGGILSSVRATREQSEDQLFDRAMPRLQALMAEGATCVEIKSGYGLTLADELKMLRVARRLGEANPVEVSPTLLAAHAIPPEFAGRADDYVHHIVREILPAAAQERLAEAVDVFCEQIAFSPSQCELIFVAARKHRLAIKGHVEQMTNQHGAELLARHGAWSADHLEYLDDAGVSALAQSGTVAVLLPGAYYFLRETRKPPIEKLRSAGVAMAVATDLNPGTSPFASLRLAMNMACVLFGLTPEEALAGATRNAATALGRGDRLGTLAVGKQADFLVWDVEHPAEIVCQLGVNPLVSRVYRGRPDHGI